MSSEKYEERCLAMGIGRGALAEGFTVEDGTSTAAQKQPKVFHRRIGERVAAAPAPDLSHLNPAARARARRENGCT